MTGTEILVLVVSIVCPIASATIAYLGFRRNKDKDTQSEGKQEGQITSDVGYIKSGVDRLEKRLDKIDEKEERFTERVAILETKVETHINNKSIHTVSRQSARQASK